MKSMSCKRTLALLERFLDDELTPARAAMLQAHLGSCDACRTEREAAARVQAGLRALAHVRCPADVAATVLAQVAAAEAAGAREARARPAAAVGATRRGGATEVRLPGESWRDRMRRAGWETWWRPALASVGVAATALCIALLARAPEPQPPDAVAVARAEEEVRWAFAYVAQVTRHASDTALESTVAEIMGTVIGERVVAPVTNAVSRPLEEDRTP